MLSSPASWLFSFYFFPTEDLALNWPVWIELTKNKMKRRINKKNKKEPVLKLLWHEKAAFPRRFSACKSQDTCGDTFVLSYPKCPWPHFWKAHAWLHMPCSLFKQAADLWNTDERQKIVIILPFYDWLLLKINVSRLIPLLTEILSSTKHNLRRLVSLAWYFHCFVTEKDPNHGE